MITIEPLHVAAGARARDRQARLTKPPGSLGVLEDVSVQLAGISGQCPPPVPTRPVIGVFAGDHGVLAQGVSPWPAEVTAQMVANFSAQGAVINALGRQIGATVQVIDVGVATDIPGPAGHESRTVRRGTADLSQEPAMSRAEAEEAFEVGREVAGTAVAAGADCLLTGDMGIGNTTPSAALVAVLAGVDPDEVTGLGTGSSEIRSRKVAVIRAALERHRPDPTDPIGVLAAVGGLEHAALAGFIIGAAEARVPVLLDGVIACSSALVAAALAPNVTGYLIAGHRGCEPGLVKALGLLGLRPLLDLDLRLGEGSGAALAFPLVQAAARVLAEVATFDGAGIDA